MGNVEATSGDSNVELQKFTANYQHYKKEYIPIVGRDFDIYRPKQLRFPEEQMMIAENTFAGESSAPKSGPADLFGRLRNSLELRKSINCPYLANLLWVNFKEQKSLCAGATTVHTAVEHSDFSIARFIQEAKSIKANSVSKSSPGGGPSSAKAATVLFQAAECLRTLNQRQMVHGFVCPQTVLLWNHNTEKPITKLLDVSLFSNYNK